MSIGNGPAQARQALEEAFARQNRRPAHLDEEASFCRHPEAYMWRYAGLRDVLIPYVAASDKGVLRWELHHVWIVEGSLRAGESNILALRRFYIEEQSWLILMGEGFARDGTLVNRYMLAMGAPCGRGRWYPA